ncbi:MAG: 4Fe-4S binding protein [Candidatus Moranbacteria bacterium]|nr:4Fe-4S binding protein [Candidatus Moranbacteria bacterium]
MENKINVEIGKCPQDHECPLVGICPVGAITQDGFAAPIIDQEKCITCGACVASCPYQALSFE